MQFSCSLFLRQCYHTRHESFVPQTPRYFSQQIQFSKMRFIYILRIEQIFLF